MILSDKQDKACYLVNGPNLLRSKEHHFSLMDIVLGKNKLGESLQDLDLIFEVETQPMSLNEKKSTNSIVIPKQEILDSDLSSSALAF